MQSHPAERAAVESVIEASGASVRSSSGADIGVDRIAKRFGTRTVLSQFDLAIHPGEFVAIVGRSGCGKSTLLRLLAGLDGHDEGRILFDGDPLGGIHPGTRIMFQDARLLPWKRVLDNVLIGLSPARRQAAISVLNQVGLADRAQDWPAVLSGGQRQRVALARALVHAPRLLLLDEPLGALDALTRIEMHQLIEALWQAGKFTAVLVTHDVGEAIALADRVVLIEEGAITLDQAIDIPRPRHRGTAQFAALEERILNRVLATPSLPPADVSTAKVAFGQLRWAI